MKEYINIVNEVINSVLLNKDTNYMKYLAEDITYKKYDSDPLSGLSNVNKDIDKIRKSSYLEYYIDKINIEENETSLKATVLVSMSFIVGGNINYSIVIDIDRNLNQITSCKIEALTPLYFATSNLNKDYFKDLNFDLLEKVYDYLFIVDFEADVCFNIKTHNKVVYSKSYQQALGNISPLDFNKVEKIFNRNNYIIEENNKVSLDVTKIPEKNRISLTFNLLLPRQSLIYTADLLFIYNEEHNKYYNLILFKDVTLNAVSFNYKLVSIIGNLDDNIKMLSHDLRNIGNNLLGYTTLSQLSLEKNPSLTKEYIDHIGISTNLLNDLVKSMLDFQDLDTGKIQLKRKEFALDDLCKNIENEVSLQAKKKNINFNIIFDNIIYDVIYTDDMKLKQILINLITNAIKFTDNNGNVTLSIDQQRINPHYYNLILKVIDNGKGIKEDFIPKLFLSYTKEDRTTEGYGLGLSIVKKFTNLLSGTVNVESKEKCGTTFTVTIPLINTLKHK